MTSSFHGKVFDYKALRLLMGIIAFTLPFAVVIIAADPLSSISASYWTAARDTFVGMLFIVSAFLFAYNGHTKAQSYTSKAAAIAAALVALFPTACDGCPTTIISIIHYSAAIILFSILTFFCLGPFRKYTRGKPGKKGLRARIYLVCGLIMAGCIVGLGISKLTLSDELIASLELTYWAEAIMLWSFGAAWIVAGKYLPILVDKEEALHLFK